MSAIAPELFQMGSNLAPTDLFEGQTGVLYDERRLQTPSFDYWRDVVDLQSPKLQIGAYVEQQGIAVPERYDSIPEVITAIERGETVIVRSEHPDEYDTLSGIFESPIWDSAFLETSKTEVAKLLRTGTDPETILSALRREQLQPDWRGISNATVYAEIKGISGEEFVNDLNFSFWKKIPGTNITVVADDTIAGRYHMAGMDSVVIDRENHDNRTGDATHYTGSGDARWDKRLIDLYESVRTLPAFDAENCPTIEMQLDHHGKLWFLQYLKGHRFNPTDYRLDTKDYLAKDGWVASDIVRGALGAYATLHSAMWYPETYGRKDGLALPEREEAAIDNNTNKALLETLIQDRVCTIFTKGADVIYGSMGTDHSPRSQWFKSLASISVPRDSLNLLNANQRNRMITAVQGGKQMARAVLDVASDGRIGFVRLNQDGDPIIIGDC